MKENIIESGKKIAKLILIISLILFLLFAQCGTITAFILFLITTAVILKKDISHRNFLIFLVVFALITRIAVVINIHNPQVSDFLTLYNISEDFLDGKLEATSQSYVNTWIFQTPFIIYQSVLLLICNKIVFLELVNVGFSILSILLMYRIMNRVATKKPAQLFTLIYAIFLNPIFYNNVLSNQHIFLFLVLLAFDLIFEEKIIKNKFVKVATCAIILALANLMRPEAIVAVLAYLFFLLYMLITKKEKIKDVFIKAIILVISFLLISRLPVMILEKTNVITEANEPSNLFKFVFGLDISSTGRWTREKYDKFFSFEDKEEQKQWAVDQIKTSLTDKRIIKLFYEKAKLFWNDFDFVWSLDYLSESGANVFGQTITLATIYEFVYKYDSFIWAIVVILSLIELLNIKNKSESKIYVLYLLGAFAIYSIIEIQPRYAFTYRPFVFIAAACGLNAIIKKLKDKKIDIKEKVVDSINSHSFRIILLGILAICLNAIALYFSVGTLRNRYFQSIL